MTRQKKISLLAFAAAYIAVCTVENIIFSSTRKDVLIAADIYAVVLGAVCGLYFFLWNKKAAWTFFLPFYLAAYSVCTLLAGFVIAVVINGHEIWECLIFFLDTWGFLHFYMAPPSFLGAAASYAAFRKVSNSGSPPRIDSHKRRP